jgi:hypothetical protein
MTDERLTALLREADAAVRPDPERLTSLLPAIERERRRARRRRQLPMAWLSIGPAIGPTPSHVPLPGFTDLTQIPPWLRPAGAEYIRAGSVTDATSLTETWLAAQDPEASAARILDGAPTGLTIERTVLADGAIRIVAVGTDPTLTVEIRATTRLGMRTEVRIVIADVPGGPFDPGAGRAPSLGQLGEGETLANFWYAATHAFL